MLKIITAITIAMTIAACTVTVSPGVPKLGEQKGDGQTHQVQTNGFTDPQPQP